VRAAEIAVCRCDEFYGTKAGERRRLIFGGYWTRERFLNLRLEFSDFHMAANLKDPQWEGAQNKDPPLVRDLKYTSRQLSLCQPRTIIRQRIAPLERSREWLPEPFGRIRKNEYRPGSYRQGLVASGLGNQRRTYRSSARHTFCRGLGR
jgi:hypothetical protein